MLELHIWGPAFGLPSFDSECIAATAYLNHHLPNDQWTLVPAHDTSVSPNADFPLLCDGDTSVAGFPAITKYLASRSSARDVLLNHQQNADSTALSIHIRTHALPLIHHHLHTSPETYNSTTLPAISVTLPRSVRYTLPSCIHATATARTVAAGLFHIDETPPRALSQPGNVDQEDIRIAGNMSPSLLFKRKETLQAALRNEQSKMRFRVEAALELLLKPLADKLKKGSGNARRRYLVGKDQPTPVDFLAFGYLAMLLYTRVQSPWLTEAIRRRYPVITEYIDSLRGQFLGGTADIDGRVIMTASSTTFFSLPWRLPGDASLTSNKKSRWNWIAPLTQLLLPSLDSRGLIPSSLQLHNDPFSRTTNPPLWLLTASLTAAPALLGCLTYFIFHYTRQEWIGWGGGDRNKRFDRPRNNRNKHWSEHNYDLGPSGFGGDAGDVLSVLFGPQISYSSSTATRDGATENSSVDVQVVREP